MTPASRPETRVGLWQRFLYGLPGLALWFLLSLGFQAAGVSQLTSHLLAAAAAFTVVVLLRPTRRPREPGR